MIQLNTKQKILIGIAIIAILLVIIYYFYQTFQISNYEEIDEIALEIQETEEIENAEENEILIHITGAVKQQGVVRLKEGARIIDAIEESGGLLEDANLNNVNLAYQLSDGQKLYIPGSSDNETEDITYVESEAGNNIVQGADTNLNEEKININTATQTQLEQLPGIGTSTAYQIVQYRQENGKFNTIEDIKNVSGIGEAKFNQIKDFICIK